MNVTPLESPQLISLKAFKDNRGVFFELYNTKLLKEYGINQSFCQDNISYSTHKHTIRGLHFQKNPAAQAKLISSLRGKIFDVVVDLRADSTTYQKISTYYLDAAEPSVLYVPKGFAHGFCTLEDNVCVLYKVDDYYSPEHDGGIIWNDPDLKIDWPLEDKTPILSDKDAKLPFLKQLTIKF